MSKIFTGSGFGLAPARTAGRNAVEKLLTGVFEQYGYQEVTLPVYEYAHVLKKLTMNFRDENVISFVDRSSGSLLVLRPDFTPQVSRMVAGHHKDFPLPARVFYRGTVFRNVNIDRGAKAEKYHVGCELYGTGELDGDRELFLCLKALMKKSGVNFCILAGDSAYLSRLALLLGDLAAEYTEILANKRLAELPSFAAKLDGPLRALVTEIPLNFGGAAELAEIRRLSAFDEQLSARCDYIQTLFAEAAKYGIGEEELVFDPSEVRGLDYYTGINFEVINRESGAAIGGGGRYDNLMRRLGLDYSACGMALDLSEIEQASSLEISLPSPDWIVLGAENTDKAEKLRAEGFTVLQLFDERELSAYEGIKVYK